MHPRPAGNRIQPVRNQMLRTAGRTGTAGNFHGNAAGQQRINQTALERRFIDIGAVFVKQQRQRIVRQQRRKVVVTVKFAFGGLFPVIESGNFGDHIPYSGIKAYLRRFTNDFQVSDDAERNAGFNRLSLTVNNQRRIRTAKTVVGSGRRNRNKGQLEQMSAEFGKIKRLAAADADDDFGRFGQAESYFGYFFNIDK